MLVLTAILVPAIVLLGALTFGVTTLWTAHDDVQRGVDLGSTAAAASTPTAAVTPGSATLPVPIDGVAVTHALFEKLDAGDWKSRACAVANGELGVDRSRVTNAFRTADDSQTCTSVWTHESPTLAMAAACAGDLLDVSGCSSAMRSTLASTLPALDSTNPSVLDLMTRAANVASSFTNGTDKFLSASTARLLPSGCTAYTRVLTAIVCTQHVSDLLNPLLGSLSNTLNVATSGVPSVGVNLDNLLPAVMTPRVNVRIDGARVRPTFSPFTFELKNSATARRTIKSAIVLPSAGIPYRDVTVDLNARLGGAALTLQSAAGVGGYVVDPNDITRAGNAALDQSLDLVDHVDGVVGQQVLGALTAAACTHSPLSRHCSEIDTVAATKAMRGQFIQDIHDAAYPPPSGAAPSVNQLLDKYATSGEAVAIVSGLQRTRLRDILGSSAWSVLTDPTVNPGLAPLLSDLMFIPALDVVPATVGRVVISGNPYYVIHSIPWSDTLATKGLFQARLVK